MEDYIEFLLRQYRVMDGLWFLAVEEEFGLEHAVRINEKVWEEMGSRSAREIKKDLRSKRGDLRVLKKR